MMKLRSLRLLQRPVLLVAPCALAVGQLTHCREPEAEPIPAASAPPADEDGGRPPAYNPESAAGNLNTFLRSSDGRSLVESVVRQVIRRAMDEELQKALAEVRRLRAVEEGVFRSQAKRLADEAAQVAARSEVERLHSLVEAVASSAVRKEAERAVPAAIREDPLMKRLLAENLQKVRTEVRAAAERELAEICDEEKYHRVNRAFLEALEKRSQKAIQRTEDLSAQSIQAARRPVVLAQGLAVTAIVMAGLALLLPRARL